MAQKPGRLDTAIDLMRSRGINASAERGREKPQQSHGVTQRSEAIEQFEQLQQEMRGSPGPLKKGTVEAKQHMAALRARRKT